MRTASRLRLLDALSLDSPRAWPTPAEVAYLRDAPLPTVRTRRPLPGLGEDDASVWGECEVPDFRALVTCDAGPGREGA